MAPNTRNGATAPKKRLAFHEKIAGKGITTDALLKKLKTLHTQLAALEQETVDVSSLNVARSELIHTSLLLHKDRGVKAYTACCLADILRLYAPEAPYTQHELRDIFQFFFRQLSAGFKGQDEPYFNEYFHLLESLSTVKSVVLVCDLPSADELLHEIFRDLFTIVKRDFTRKVELYMADILVALVDESNSLPSDVLEVIMSQFIEKNARAEQPGYRLAVQVCNDAADKLQRHVCQYFGDLITSTAEEVEDEDLDTMRTSHELVKRLHRSCPAVLHSVIPILETELRADGLNPRLLATQTLGEMYADKGGPDLVRKYPTTWAAWINRKADISVAVRLKCVEATPPLITNIPDARDAIQELLLNKVLDPDDKVRAAACKVYSHLDYEAALHHVSEEQLRSVADRGLDKKARPPVRTEALNSIGNLYSLAYPEIENNDPAAIKQFAWIPDEVLKMTSLGSEIRAMVEQVLFESILPLPSAASPSATKEKTVDEVAWTDRLLGTMRYLSDKSINTLIGISGLKATRPNLYDVFLDSCVKNNGGIVDGDEELIVKRFKTFTQHLAATFPDPVKAAEDLEAFARLNENRLYKLLKACMDPQTDLKTFAKSSHEFLKRTEQLSSNILNTMTILIRRASYSIVNQSAVPTLFKQVEKSQTSNTTKAQQNAANATKLLSIIAKHSPVLLKPHVALLTKIIAGEKKGNLAELALMALANIARADEKAAATIDKKTTERIVKLALGDDWRQAKFASRYLSFAKGKDTFCAEVVESIASSMEEEDAVTNVANIAALGQLARFAPDAFEQKSDVIMAYIVNRILMVPTPVDDPNPEEEWLEDSELQDDLRAKLLSLKVCRNRCLAHSDSDQALEIATPVIKLLVQLINYEGSLSAEAEEDPKAKTRLRLQAAVSLLHLSTVETFATAIAPDFLRLACASYDSCYNVREAFLTKLITLLQPRKLPARYNVITFLTIADPEKDVRDMASSYIVNTKRRMSPAVRMENLELIFIRLLHILAHHPDFGTSKEDLMDMANYIHFYLDLIASADNVSFLYHLAQKGKTVRDPESHSASENFYIVCELAQVLIKSRAQQNSWLLPSYPGKVRLPADILRPLPNAQATNQILKTIYLPQGANEWLIERFKLPGYKEMFGQKDHEPKTREKKEKKERVPTKRKAPSTKTNGRAKRARRKHDDSDEDDEDDIVEDVGSDVEMDDTRPSKPRRSDASEQGGRLSRAERLSARTKAKERLSTGNRDGSSPLSEPEDDDNGNE
ncbi:hypothetical protein D9619_010650 [Psilocybe cf. subviscida]|uniref:Sister chromatid cohesion protein n=1 Tax=Psilocybe cf. subviscida TaxID=2480587 RepID=A0A8H5B8Q0_9AGAR|nr:hypothetical protein D9619_010650 [Psilocybe cf. subviscida]